MASDVRLDVPVRPLNVTFPRPAVRSAGRFTKALLYGDTHHPYHCAKTLAVVQAILADLKPDVVVDMGDGVDCGDLSGKFKQNPARKDRLQDEINLKRIQLATFRDIAPNAKFHYREGNHENRLQRSMWDAEGTARALMQLDVVQRNLTWPTLLSLDELHIEFAEYGKQTEKLILPKFIVKHGDVVRKNSGYTATAELGRYNRSGASGHTHRLGVVWMRDHHGQHVWIETGTCATLKPEYMQDPNWQNGCVVLTFDNKTGAVMPEPIEIRAGHTIWRGKEYKA